MKTETMTNEKSEPRSTAYYYGDLERIKQNQDSENQTKPETTRQPPKTTRQNSRQNGRLGQNGRPSQNDALSEHVETIEVFNQPPTIEIPPFRDRRQLSLPEYSTPEGCKKLPGETYSTAGTFPLREKEPLLAELEVVGRLPLTQLDSGVGVRRSRSWYLCCPNSGDEEVCRESSWRYSSLRPVTAPPVPRHADLALMVTSQSTTAEDPISLKQERDALARALTLERQKAVASARAHDARLAELHGVIAELTRRRTEDRHNRAIPEEESEKSEECESTTQPAGELENDADHSRTEQNDTSSMLSVPDLSTPRDSKDEDASDELANNQRISTDCSSTRHSPSEHYELCLSSGRCCQSVREGGSCERERGSLHEQPFTVTASPGRAAPRHAKLASRVRLRRTDEPLPRIDDDTWAVETAKKLALDVCAQADVREAIAAKHCDEASLSASLSLWEARCRRLAADNRVLECALARASDAAYRLSSWVATQETRCLSICSALQAADRSLECYDVLLALSETRDRMDSEERKTAELVAHQLLARLECNSETDLTRSLVSPGPWIHNSKPGAVDAEWSAACEERLRAHAARLKAESVRQRRRQPPPALYTPHDADPDNAQEAESVEEMEAAVLLQEAAAAAERRAERAAAASQLAYSSSQSRKRAENYKLRQMYGTQPRAASETDL